MFSYQPHTFLPKRQIIKVSLLTAPAEFLQPPAMRHRAPGHVCGRPLSVNSATYSLHCN